jgi:hypothetical protein
MEKVTEYLERSLQFELLAAQESDPKLKAQLLDQAEAYRKLAAEHAAEVGVPTPTDPENSN